MAEDLRARGAPSRPLLAMAAPQRRARDVPRASSAPRRYRIRESAAGAALLCVEAPTISVRVERGACVGAAQARRAPPGTIYLDGAAQGAPFADAARGVYNLDHHAGCVRAFTLSACEQAMVLLLRGLDLRRREWSVLANDADLDAVLAIWVLLNHARLSSPDEPARAEILPLLRLEGAIDAHGLALAELAALSPELLAETRERLDRLHESERRLRASNRWQSVDLLAYTRERLELIDSFVYAQGAFAEWVEFEELGRVSIAGGSTAVACRSSAGIYEVERQLTRLHGPRLGLLVLCQPSGVYTLRQLDAELPASLEALYARLNRIDPAARAGRSERRWGGSAELGGSPRMGGSDLAPAEILAACEQVFVPRRSRLRRIGAVLVSGVVALAVCAAVLLLEGAG